MPQCNYFLLHLLFYILYVTLVREDTMLSAVVHATKIGVGLVVWVFITAGWAVNKKLLVCVYYIAPDTQSTSPFASNEEYTTSKMWYW